MELSLDEILEAVERTSPRLELLKSGYDAIYWDKEVSKEYMLLHQPDGKCYLIDYDDNLKQNIIIRELNKEEYSKIDLIKGRDY